MLRNRDDVYDSFDRAARKANRRPPRDRNFSIDPDDYDDVKEDPIFPDDVPAEV